MRINCGVNVLTNSNHQGKRNDLLSVFGPIRDHFHPKQHQLTAQRYRQQLRQRFQDWREAAGLVSAA
jgi:putative transposase